MKILVIAPHPDDEVLGCGGTIKKYSKRGAEVYLCILTKANSPDWSEEFLRERPKEIEKSNKILGIKKTYFLDFPTAKLDSIGQKELNDAVCKVVREVKPEIIYAPHGGDLNKDHRLVFEAVLVATRPNTKDPVRKVLCYETASETEWGVSPFRAFNSNVYEDITEELKTKLEAMKAYKSELKDSPHPRSLQTLSCLAKIRGSEAGLLAAEAFVLIRDIKN